MDPAAPVVVIVAYRADAHLEECLTTLGSSLTTVVVDNDASDSTRDICATAGVTYLRAPHNLGFAAGVNLGISELPGRDVLLLNPDARISADDVLRLQRFLRADGRRAAVGPRLVDPAGRPEAATWPMPSPAQVWKDAAGMRARGSGASFVTGAVLLLRAEALAELGGLDERYFLYAEEADWQQRALRAGWTVAVADDVLAVHAGGASSDDAGVRRAIFNTSARAFARRWYGWPGALAMRAGSLVAAARRAMVPGPPSWRRFRAQLASGAPVGGERPRVAHVVRSTSFAGVERSVVDLATEQYRRGWRVVVVGGDAEAVRRELPPGVLHLRGETALAVLSSLARVGRVDVLHAHMTAAEAMCVLAKPLTGGRLVTTRHFAARRGSSLPARWAGSLFARFIDVEVSISRYVADSIGVPSVVVPNGVRVSDETAERARTVLVMQRLEPEKSTDTAIRAWAETGLGERGWRLVVHGRGSLHDDLVKLTEELGCSDSVDIAGYTSDARGALRRASVLLATAPAEPFGLTVAEAMAEGTPVLAADGGAHREVLGPDGSYFTPGDVTEAAKVLTELCELDPAERRNIGERLRARQRTAYSIDSQVTRLLQVYAGRSGTVTLFSLEPWDDVWRRNQHFAARLVRSGAVTRLRFVNPPTRGLSLRPVRENPVAGVEVVTPPLVFPRRWGGHGLLGAWLRRESADSDVWWVNDPVAGDRARRLGAPVVYDVTDDWREMSQGPGDRRRIVAAEDRLARDARIVVCSTTLASRWRERYGADTTLIGNGVDVDAISRARPRALHDPDPHLLYVGTLHPNRVDTVLLGAVAEKCPGTLHLVGPDALPDDVRARLDALGVRRHGPVPSDEVPSWLAAADVLLCPHVVDEFTLSLDAIKAYEYLATQAPVVATPSSGFQSLEAPGLHVVGADGFVDAVLSAIGSGPFERTAPASWDERAAEFAAVLESQLDVGRDVAS